MNGWLRPIRGAFGMGLTWAVGWALAGLLIGVSSKLGAPMDWFFKLFDAPLPALAVPGFFCGPAFSLVLGIAGRRRPVREWSLLRFAAWGALAGALVASVPLLAGRVPLDASVVALGTLIVLSTASASATWPLARRTEQTQLRDGGLHAGDPRTSGRRG